MDSLNLKEFDLEFAVDPLFKKTSAEFDEGGAKGLLLNHLNVYGQCKLIFDASDIVEEQTCIATPDVDIDMSRLEGTACILLRCWMSDFC